MKFIVAATAFAVAVVGVAHAQQPTLSNPLLDHLRGAWVATGTIGGSRTSHDVTAEWVLSHQYLRLHEIARERKKDGSPGYEGVIHIGWNAKTATYGCVWLDDFGGLNTQSIGAAAKRPNQLPFVFTNLDGSFTRTTMTFSPTDDTWTWTIDEDRAGKLSRFATLKMVRAK